MKSVKTIGMVAFCYLVSIQQVLAIEPPCDGGPPLCPGNGTAVPEIDGSGAIIAIGLAAGLVALFREKYFRK